MHLDKIHAICNFNNDVVRNTPSLNADENEFSDLIDNKFDLNVVKKTIGKSCDTYINKIEHHAIDYVFKQPLYFKSRFSDGSYPVWYGSLDIETSCHETVFHWYRTIIQDMYYDDNIPIITNRSIFKVGCDAILIDLRKSINNIPALIDKSFESYNVTQAISKEIYDQGQSGLYTYSARKNQGENIAIFNRKSLKEVEYLQDVEYKYDFAKSKVFVVDKQSAKLILEI